ncbi:MAG: hypothetical protein ABIA04_04460 [Pseudomonadota bacterium]
MIKYLKKHKSLIFELLPIAIIILAWIKISYGIMDSFDLKYWDESDYLSSGVNFKSAYFFTDGFLYFLWYKLLSLFSANTIKLYFLNYAVLILLNPIFLYILLRRIKLSIFVCLTGSLIFLISYSNCVTWPFITRFAFLIMLITLILLTLIKNDILKYLIALTGIISIVYVRCEHILSLSLFLAGFSIYFLYTLLKKKNKRYLRLLILNLLVVLFVLFLKNPTDNKRLLTENRLMIAFGQHYALNTHLQGEFEYDPMTNWPILLQEKFKTTNSLSTAFFNNPFAVFKHISLNIFQLGQKIINVTCLPYFIKDNYSRAFALILLLIVSGFTIIKVVINIKDNYRVYFNINNIFNDKIFFFLTMLLFFIPTITIILLIFPRDHYLVPFWGMILIVTIFTLFSNFKYNFKYAFPAKIIFIILFLYFIPWNTSLTFGLLPSEKRINVHEKYCTNLKKLRIFNELIQYREVTFLGDAGTFEMYLHGKLNHYYQGGKQDKPFPEYIKEKNFDIILVAKSMLKNIDYAQDQTFLPFINSLPNKEWSIIRIDKCEDFVIIRRDYLKEISWEDGN